MANLRLFLGIELKEETKTEIASMLAPLKTSEKGWENLNDYHLTLLFIGETPEEKLPEIINQMKRISTQSFQLSTTKFHFFSRRIMYLGFEHSVEVLELRKKIFSLYPEYNRLGDKEFIPHVTVKRWQRYEYADLISGLEKHPEHSLHIPVNEIALFKSEKDSENRKYHVIHREKL